MLAFHNDVEIKDRYLERLSNRQKYPQLCKIYVDYEYLLGIPNKLGKLHDIIVQQLPFNLAKEFSKNFISVIPVGADLSNIMYPLTNWLITDKVYGHSEDIRESGMYSLSIIEDIVFLYREKTYASAIEHAKPFSGNTMVTRMVAIQFAEHNAEMATKRIWTTISHQLLALLENVDVPDMMQKSSNPAEHLTPLLRW